MCALFICCTAVRHLFHYVYCSRQHRAESGQRTALRGGEGSYRGLGVEGGGAMLKGVGTMAVRCGRGGARPHTSNWLNGARSRL